MPFKRVKEAIEAIRNGEMIIIMDDEDRENEGDLVFAAEFCTAEKINFMTKEARGLICVSITNELAKKLDLKPMVEYNSSNHETAFTVSIDAKEAKTGISAFERNLTIQLMCNTDTTQEHFVRPGHIFPLIAKQGGVLVRTGHTEASVDICTLAGLKKIAVICEIMKKDGSMAKRGDKFLIDFAKKYNMKILYVSDLIAYRLQFEQLLTIKERTFCQFLGTECEKILFEDHCKKNHFAFVFGKNLHSQSLFKFNNISTDIELFTQKQKFKHIQDSLELFKNSSGVLIFLDAHSTNKTDIKDFGIGAQIVRLLGVKEFNLLTSHESIEFVGLSGFGLNIKEKIILN